MTADPRVWVMEFVTTLAGQGPEHPVEEADRLDRDLDLGPRDRLQLAREAGDEFEIEIAEETREGWITVEDVIRTVTELI